MLSLRRDFHLYNEATGWVVTSEGRNGRPTAHFGPRSKHWKAAIEDGSFVPMTLDQDDSLNVRLVVGDSLTPEEDAEWVDRLEWKLSVPDGRLALTSGIEYLSEGEAYDMECLRVIDIEPGTYRVEVFTLLPGVNGVACLARAGVGDDDIGKYYRATRPGEALPEWLAAWEEDDACEDEDDEENPSDRDDDRDGWRTWDDAVEMARHKELHVDPSDREPQLIDFIVRLSPLGSEVAMPKMDRQWFARHQQPRKPALAPRGVYSNSIVGVHDVPDYVQTELGYKCDVWTRVKGLELAAVAGGPVALPIDDIALTYWLAWLCQDGPFVQVRVDLEGKPFSANFPPLELGFEVHRDAKGLTIDLDGMNAKWANIRRMHRIARDLRGLPDGAILEVRTAEETDEDDDSRASHHRYRGPIRGGVWHIESSFPALDARTLSGALELARQIDAGGPLQMRDASEAEAILTKVAKHDFLLRDKPPTRSGLELSADGDMLTAMLGAWVFRERFSGPFETADSDDDLESWDAAMQNITDTFAAPRSQDVVYEGQTGLFFKADMSQLASVNAKLLASHDSKLAKLGFEHVGDVTAAKFGDVVVRAYAKGAVYGAWLRSTLGFGGLDFYTRFPDGWSLTTSTIAGSDEPSKRSYRQSGPEDFSKLYKAHQARIDELSDKHGKPAAVEPSLEGLAAAMDEFLAREPLKR